MQMTATNAMVPPSEMMIIKEEINQLKTILAKAVAQIIKAVASLCANKGTPPSNDAMEMEDANKSSETVHALNPPTQPLLTSWHLSMNLKLRS